MNSRLISPTGLGISPQPRTAEAFATAAASASQQLAKTEEQVVTLGRALDAEVGQAVEEIDLAAPPPGGRAAGRPAASF